MIKLYQFQLSGNSHKIRLMLSLLGLSYETIDVSGAQREQKSSALLSMNPFGQVPVLEHDEVALRDSQAILAYLGQTFGSGTWWPENPLLISEVIAWFSTAANEVAHGPNLLRLHYRFGREIDVAAAEEVSQQLLHVLEKKISDHDWLVGSHVTVADVALYPYIALAPEARINLETYPAIRGWLIRIQALPGYLDMPGMWREDT